MQRLEHRNADGYRYWIGAVTTRSESTLVSWEGDSDSDYRIATEKAESLEAAHAKLDQCVQQKLAEGYVVVSEHHESLDEHILQNPDDPRPYLALADWLQRQGDPRAELILLQYALSQETDEAQRAALSQKSEQLIEAHQARWLLPDRHLVDEVWVSVDWQFGFARSVWMGTGVYPHTVWDFLDLLELLRQHPSMRFLQELVITDARDEGIVRLDICVAHLLKAPLPSTVTSLGFETTQVEYLYPDVSRVQSLDRLAQTMPQLRSLTAYAADLKLQNYYPSRRVPLQFPALEKLVLQTSSMSEVNLKLLATTEWTRLTELELWFGAAALAEYGDQDRNLPPATIESTRPLLSRALWPVLKKLSLRYVEFADELCEAIATCDLLPQLTELDLSSGCLTAEGVQHLIRNAEQFRHLEKFNVSDNALTPESVERLKDVFPQIQIDEQDPERTDNSDRFGDGP